MGRYDICGQAIFSGKSFHQEQTSLWALILPKPVTEVVEFRPADWPEKVKRNTIEKKGMLSHCKCLFEWIGANSAYIQPENLKNVQKCISGKRDQIFQNINPLVGDTVINLGKLSKASPKTPGIPQNWILGFFLLTL